MILFACLLLMCVTDGPAELFAPLEGNTPDQFRTAELEHTDMPEMFDLDAWHEKWVAAERRQKWIQGTAVAVIGIALVLGLITRIRRRLVAR